MGKEGVSDDELAASIDGALAQADENGEQKKKDPHADEPIPDNYRPPPKQDVKRKERRERPNIHNHPLLKSMDLSFVGGFNDGRAKQKGPIGLLGEMGRAQRQGQYGFTLAHTQQPAYAAPSPYGAQPVYGQPVYAQPSPYGAPRYAQPVYAQPRYAQPVYAQPRYGQPVYGAYGRAPVYGQPQYAQPVYGRPQYA